MDLNALQALIALETYGSLSAASEYLRISQPALSRTMQKLERQCNVPLFVRSKNSISLNANGKLLCREGKKLLKSEEELIEKVQHFDQSHRTIRIGYSAPGPRLAFEKCILESFPQATVSWTMQSEEELLKGLEKGNYTFVFLRDQDMPSSFYRLPCLQEQLYLCVLPEHPCAEKKEGIYFHDVDGQTFLQRAHIGIWEEIVRTCLPHSRSILQTNPEDLITLINSSHFPAFVTNLTDKKKYHYEQRLDIPFLNPEARVTFDCVIKRKDIPYFSVLLKQIEKKKQMF